MAFDNPTNRSRGHKMAELLTHLITSASSNKATPAEIESVLLPLAVPLEELGLRLERIGGAEGEGQDATRSLKAGEIAALKLADQASTRELIASLIGRLEHHAAQIGEGEQ